MSLIPLILDHFGLYVERITVARWYIMNEHSTQHSKQNRMNRLDHAVLHKFLHEKIHFRAAGLEVNDCMASASAADGAMPEDMDTAEEPKSDDSSDSSSSSSSDSDSYDGAEQRRLAYELRLTLGN